MLPLRVPAGGILYTGEPMHVRYVSRRWISRAFELVGIVQKELLQTPSLSPPLSSSNINNRIITQLGLKGCPNEARMVFKSMENPSIASWNAMISAYARNGFLEQARELFDSMPRRDVVSWNAMVTAYGKYGNLEEARALFREMPLRDVVSWTTMIGVYAQSGHPLESLRLFQLMCLEGLQPNRVTYLAVLDACACAGDLRWGKLVHDRIASSGLGFDVRIGTSLIYMYGKCRSLKDAECVFGGIIERDIVCWNAMINALVSGGGQLEQACSLFNRMPEQNVASWNSLISAYSERGYGVDALMMFQKMVSEGETLPDKITFLSCLDACAGLCSLNRTKMIHVSITCNAFDSDVALGTALVNTYGKCKDLSNARRMFDRMSMSRNVVLWTAMITAYAHNGQNKQALEMFCSMDILGLKPNKITFVSTLDVCASLVALEHGKIIHAHVIGHGYESDIVVGNAILNMYGKCGSLEAAKSAFDKMPQLDVVSWSTLIAVYAQSGQGEMATHLFERMEMHGVMPNKITFISILSACSHSGLLEKGWAYFHSMMGKYAIQPTVDHYICVIDVLGRAGQLAEAEDMITDLVPFEPPFEFHALAWVCLLGACRIHGDIERGMRAAEQMFELEPTNPAPYILLSNIFASLGKWEDVAMVSKLMKDRGVKKRPGLSCIELKHKVHEFVAGDKSHPKIDSIHTELRRLRKQVEEAGYEPDRKAILLDVDEEEKEHILWHHSERLAIALGLISTPPGTPLRIVKNLRVCSDCHVATKFISKITGRKITMRDGNRYHHFEHGVCSCGDYW